MRTARSTSAAGSCCTGVNADSGVGVCVVGDDCAGGVACGGDASGGDEVLLLLGGAGGSVRAAGAWAASACRSGLSTWMVHPGKIKFGLVKRRLSGSIAPLFWSHTSCQSSTPCAEAMLDSVSPGSTATLSPPGSAAGVVVSTGIRTVQPGLSSPGVVITAP